MKNIRDKIRDVIPTSVMMDQRMDWRFFRTELLYRMDQRVGGNVITPVARSIHVQMLPRP